MRRRWSWGQPSQASSKRPGWVAAVCGLLVTLSVLVLASCSDDSTGPGKTDNSFEWTTAAPEEYGFDPELLDTLTSKTSAGDFGRITSVLVVRSGYLVYEEYFRGVGKSDLVSIYSCTKSIASALVGIAIDEGKIGGVDDKLFDYLEGYTLYPHGAMDSTDRESITLEHLLTMTAGFDWEEWDVPYGQTENSYTEMVQTDDYVQFVLDRNVFHTPGTHFEYNTGLSGLMAVVLENSTGERADDYARSKLFGHIGIDTCIWRITPTGVPMTGSGVKLRPRDMAKFGWLYSQHGIWDGDTIVPPEWVETSCQRHVSLSANQGYGYQWWVAAMSDDDGSVFDTPYALGWGGQHILVPPVYDIVIVVTADDDPEVAGQYIGELVSLIGDAFTSPGDGN